MVTSQCECKRGEVNSVSCLVFALYTGKLVLAGVEINYTLIYLHVHFTFVNELVGKFRVTETFQEQCFHISTNLKKNLQRNIINAQGSKADDSVTQIPVTFSWLFSSSFIIFIPVLLLCCLRQN